MVRAGSFRKAKPVTARGSGRSMRMAMRSPGLGAKTVVSRRVRLNGGNDFLSILHHFLVLDNHLSPNLSLNPNLNLTTNCNLFQASSVSLIFPSPGPSPGGRGSGRSAVAATAMADKGEGSCCSGHAPN